MTYLYDNNEPLYEILIIIIIYNDNDNNDSNTDDSNDISNKHNDIMLMITICCY